MNEIVEKLMRPFPPESIKQREGAAHRSFDYVEGENIIERLIEATGGRFDVEVLSGPEMVAYTNPRTSQATAFWMARVRLTIPDLGSREQIGTALPENEDAPKSAVTDGLKKAATLFGVALQLYENGQKPAGQASRTHRAGAEAGGRAAAPKPTPSGEMTDDQRRAIIALSNRKGVQPPDMEGWTSAQAGEYLKKLQERAA